MKKLISLLFATMLLITPVLADTTAGAPSNVSLTIYNQDFALVKENRAMKLPGGISYLTVPDVAATIDPDSVAFKSITDPNSVVVREQNYRFDVINRNSLLAKSVGKEIVLDRILPNGSIETITGVLLSSPENGLVIRDDKGRVIIDPQGTIRLKELPEGLVSRPTLVWKLETTKFGEHTAEVSYLANQIGWSCNYVAVIDPMDKFIDLTGWVTLTNNSGVNYDNATLNLMAGDVRRIQPIRMKAEMYAVGMARDAAAPEPQFSEKSFFEYHLYTLKDKTTVRDKETKQITLTSSARIPAKKLYIYDGRRQWWDQWRYASEYRPGASYDVSSNKKVNVLIEVVNSKDNNLGIPLPKGKIKVYKQDSTVNQQFIGEDQIDHTPKDEKIRLYLGDAFDVVGEHTRTGFRSLSPNMVEETFEITLRNHKDTPVNILAVEHLLGDWKIVQSTHKYYKKDASTVEIPVEVPANGEVKIDYTARTKW